VVALLKIEKSIYQMDGDGNQCNNKHICTFSQKTITFCRTKTLLCS